MRTFALVLAFLLVGCSNSGCSGTQRKAVERAELACLEQTMSSALAKFAAASAQGSGAPNKAAIVVELTAEELACAAAALAAHAPASSGSDKP